MHKNLIHNGNLTVIQYTACITLLFAYLSNSDALLAAGRGVMALDVTFAFTGGAPFTTFGVLSAVMSVPSHNAASAVSCIGISGLGPAGAGNCSG